MQHRAARTLALCTAAALAGAAQAETSPYYIGVSQGFGYMSNLYSTQNDPISSALSTTSLVGGFDQPVGRQRFYGSANVGYNYFFNDEVRNLDNTSYGLNLGWDWQTIERLSGTLRLTANQSLVYYNIAGTPSSTGEKNIQNVGEFDFTGRYGISPDIGLNLGYTYRKVNFSAEVYADEEYNQNTGRVGLTFGKTAIWAIGTWYRYQRTEYPFYPHPFPSTELGDTGDGNNFDVTIKWIPNGLSTVDARLSYSDISYEVNKARDFDGFNGSVSWTWLPTGKTKSVLSFIGAPGYTSTFYAFVGAPVQVNNSRFARTLRWNVTYLATGKTSFTAGVNVTKDYLTQTIFSNTQEGSDLISTATLGLTYTPTRSSQLSCNASYSNRSVSDNAERYGMSYPYHAASIMCTGQLVLQ